MVAAGAATDEHIDELLPLLSAGDLIVDGGNTFFRDDIRRHEAAGKLGIRHLRLTRDCLGRSRRMASGRWFYRVSHAGIYEWLSNRARPTLQSRGIRHAQITFGLLQDSHVDEEYILKLLPELPAGDSELYSHPSLDKFKHEYAALVSPRVKALVAAQGIQLIRYQDL